MKEKLVGWVQSNPKLTKGIVALACVVMGTVLGVQLQVRSASPGQPTTITIDLSPELLGLLDAPGVFGVPPSQGEVAGLSSEGRRALRVGGGILRERREGQTLFAGLLYEIYHDPAAIEKYELLAATQPSRLDPATITIAAKIAIKVMIAILERTAANTRTTFDDRLLQLLQVLDRLPLATR